MPEVCLRRPGSELPSGTPLSAPPGSSLPAALICSLPQSHLSFRAASSRLPPAGVPRLCPVEPAASRPVRPPRALRALRWQRAARPSVSLLTSPGQVKLPLQDACLSPQRTCHLGRCSVEAHFSFSILFSNTFPPHFPPWYKVGGVQAFHRIVES